MAAAPTFPLIPIIVNGSACVGHVLDRGRTGFEALTADDISLGVFPTAADAVVALIDHASGPPPPPGDAA
jgi:hypothetical protein